MQSTSTNKYILFQYNLYQIRLVVMYIFQVQFD